MRIVLLFALLLLCSTTSAMSQQLSWKALSLPKASDRYNDVWFVTPEIGWAIIPSESGTAEDGHIYKTTDGGSTWTDQYATSKHLRSMCFLDTLVGFVGFLYDGSSSPLLQTTDGGATWTSAEIRGSMPFGICGMMRVDDNTVVGSGQVSGPAHFIRTTDRGKTWNAVAITSNERDWAIDCYFWSRDSGIVAGGTKSGLPPMVSHIWRTTDGGANWTDAYVGDQYGEWCWKISFPSENIGYISIQQDFSGGARVLKTTDRGKTWRRIALTGVGSILQGCGFISDQHGWVGGRSPKAYVTEDGGTSWNPTTELGFVNRFRFFGDTLGYAAGSYIYKLSSSTSDVAAAAITQPKMSYDAVEMSLQVSTSTNDELILSDVLGREVMRLQLSDDPKPVSLRALSPGVYLARLSDGTSLKFSR